MFEISGIMPIGVENSGFYKRDKLGKLKQESV